MNSLELPFDQDLPATLTGFDAAAVKHLLRMRTGVEPGLVRLRYLEYSPGERFLTMWRDDSGGPNDLFVVSAGWLGSPDEDIDVARFPADPALRVGELTGADVLAWVPYQRAVLRRVSGHPEAGTIEKYFATQNAFDTSLRAAAMQLDVPTAAVVAVDSTRRCVTQRLVAGRGFDASTAVELANDAGQMLRRLHQSSPDALPTFGPAELLAQSEPVVDLMSFAHPDLAERLEGLQRRLRLSSPELSDLVTSHGDFNVGQLVGEVTERRVTADLTLVDLDTLCLAPAALDIAAYATNVVSGRSGDVDRCLQCLREVKTGYAAGPIDGLDWYVAATLLRRCDRSLRRAKKDWRIRAERLVDATERFADSLG